MRDFIVSLVAIGAVLAVMVVLAQYDAPDTYVLRKAEFTCTSERTVDLHKVCDVYTRKGEDK